MSIVCLDTQIIQWGVINRASDQQSQKYVEHARNFIEWLDRQNVEVIIPSIIIGELLVPVHHNEHAKVLAQISEDWMIVDFDVRAATVFAQMRFDKAIKQIMDDIRAGNPYATRRQLVADVMIIATAVVNGAEKIYSHNKDFLKLAQDYIPAENFADIQLQSSLLDDEATEDE